MHEVETYELGAFVIVDGDVPAPVSIDEGRSSLPSRASNLTKENPYLCHPEYHPPTNSVQGSTICSVSPTRIVSSAMSSRCGPLGRQTSPSECSRG